MFLDQQSKRDIVAGNFHFTFFYLVNRRISLPYNLYPVTLLEMFMRISCHK